MSWPLLLIVIWIALTWACWQADRHIGARRSIRRRLNDPSWSEPLERVF
jgi:hypothetical protein